MNVVVYLSSLLYIVCGVILVFGCVLVFYFFLLLFWQSGVIDLVVGNSIYLTERRRDNPSFVSDPHFSGQPPTPPVPCVEKSTLPDAFN